MMKVDHEPYGTMPDGRPVTRYRLSGGAVTIELLSYGAILTSVRTPDREGKSGEITLGLDTLEQYLAGHPFFGATVGRFANRIARGTFELDGKRYTLYRNNGENHLHGGKVGFDKRVWSGSPFSDEHSAGVRFSYTSPDGEEGYPGLVEATVTYTLRDDSLEIRYEATSDAATPINLTNHTYWNLKGSGTVEDHLLTLSADSYLPVDEGLIPTGEIRSVDSTPFDFRNEKRVGAEIEAAGGYDHCFVIASEEPAPTAANGRPLRPAARLYEPTTGRGLRLSATQPGVQFYTGNMLTGIVGRGGLSYGPRTGVCLETEAFPDAVNQPSFPSAILRPGESYDEVAKVEFYCN